MICLIGDKRSMAIEYRVANPASLTAHARLWFEGQQLGSLKDVIYLDGYLLGCLSDLARKPCLAPRYQNKDAYQLFNILEQELGSWDEDDGHDLSEQARPFFDVRHVVRLLFGIRSPLGRHPRADHVEDHR